MLQSIKQKIAIIGVSGSGKSTFSRELAHRTGLPLFHMDNLFWRGDWEPIDEEQYIAEQSRLIARERWIIEGYVDEALSDRLKFADLIIYLDYSRWRCLLQALSRWLKYRRTSRPELPPEALERFNMYLFWTILTLGERPGIEKSLRGIDPAKVKRFRSPHELASGFVKHL